MRVTKAEVQTLGRPRPPKPLPEKAIQRAILDFLETVPGVYAFKPGTGLFPMIYKGRPRMVRMGRVGVSDIVGWRRGRAMWEPGYTTGPDARIGPVAQFLAIEVKRRGRSATPEQQAFLNLVRGDGGIAIVAHSVGDVVAALGLGTVQP